MVLLYIKNQVFGVCLTQYTDTSNLSLEKNSKGSYINAWIVSEQVPVYECFKEKKNVRKIVLFSKRFKIIKDNYRIRFNKKYWSLLVSDNGKINSKTIIGWVSHDDIIINNVPLKAPNSTIYKKIFVKEGNFKNGTTFRIYSDRKLTRIKDSMRIDTNKHLFYVYDYNPRDIFLSDSSNIISLLIGVPPQLDTSHSEDDSLLGWIDRRIVTFWETRLACEFSVGQPGKLYDENDEIIFQTGVINKLSAYNEFKNPILKIFRENYLIGMFTRLKEKKHIESGFEVLFVIDANQSTLYAIKQILDSLNMISSEIDEKSKDTNIEKPKFALMVYKRVKNKVSNDFCQTSINLNKMGSLKNFATNLEKHIHCNYDPTYQSPMYLALIQGVKKCHFDINHNRLRVIIHLGDSCDDGFGNYTPKDVSTILKNNNIFKYISINVSGNNLSGFNESVQKLPFKKSSSKHINQFQGLGNTIVSLIKEFFQDLKFINNQNDKVYKYKKGYVEGLVSKNSSLKKYALVSMTDLEKMTHFLTNMIESPALTNRKEVWNISLQILLGGQSCIKEDGQMLSIEECNKLRNGIPIKAGFLKYTINQFLNLSGHQLQKVLCEAKILREQLRAFVVNKYIRAIKMRNISTCDFDAYFEMDINGDGKIIHQSNDTNKSDIDRYFFREGGQRMAWIPIEHFSLDY